VYRRAVKLTRRSFLIGSTAGAALAALAAPGRLRLADARGLLTDPTLDALIQRTLAAARKAGATYADVRIVRRRRETLRTREAMVQGVDSTESYGVGVRVVADGAWGFAATPLVIVAEAEKAARQAVEIARANAPFVPRKVELAPMPASVDVWQTPLERDPFKIPLEDKADLLLALNAEVMKVKGVKFCTSGYEGQQEWKLLATSDGAYVEQEIVRVEPTLSATAVDAKTGEFVSRDHEIQARQAGWEYIADSTLLADARRIGEEAVEKLAAPSVTPGPRDTIIAPSNLWLTIHESVGHPTELDRALGDEANFAGTSFATTDKLNKLRYAAPALSFFADKTTPGGLATCGYDDDGVKTQRWYLVKNGLFVGYQTTREQAAWIGEKTSRGTSYAQDYASVPFQRMPNVSLEPGPKPLSLEDLVAATDDGIVISGRGSWSIDHQRYNFQFGGQAFYEVKKGKRTRMLKDVAYQANTVAFWNSCDLLGGAASWQLGGAMNDGKGEPGQTNAVSHGCPPARFKKLNIINTNARSKG
jgi:TldD protein